MVVDLADRILAMTTAQIDAEIAGLLAERPILREALAATPIRSAAMRLEWLLVPDDTLNGLTPVEAANRRDEHLDAQILALARGWGA